MLSGGYRKRPMAWNRLKVKIICTEQKYVYALSFWLDYSAYRKFTYIYKTINKTTRCSCEEYQKTHGDLNL